MKVVNNYLSSHLINMQQPKLKIFRILNQNCY